MESTMPRAPFTSPIFLSMFMLQCSMTRAPTASNSLAFKPAILLHVQSLIVSFSGCSIAFLFYFCWWCLINFVCTLYFMHLTAQLMEHFTVELLHISLIGNRHTGARPAYIELQLLYSGKFLYGANFRKFHMLHPLYENKNCENLNLWKFFPFMRDLWPTV